jgi:hypothetical protein
MTWKCSACEHQNLGRHQRCQKCNDPKDKGEKYEMPADTASAPSVDDDAGLMRLAGAGPNWTCSYCGSHQRKLDGSCQQCGASASEAEVPVIAPFAPSAWQRRLVAWLRSHKIAVGIGVGVLLVIAIVLWMRRERTYGAVVKDVQWKQIISVERYKIWSREGWRSEQPSAAFDVVSQGQKVHHYDDVPDGYRTEYYTEQVACGQECRDVPERCSERCTSNENGFATCTTSCTGGGRSCSTKYCSEQRSRQVQKYRKEPRYAESIAYKIWDWGFDRQVQATGSGITGMRWPTEEARIGQNLGDGEKEREVRSAEYDVTLGYDDSERVRFGVALEDLPKYAIGTRHELRIKGDRVVVDGKPVQRN